MVRSAVFAVLLAASAGAAAQPGPAFAIPRTALDKSQAQSPFALTDADDSNLAAKKRGVIAGVDLAPDAAVGFGVFSAAPRPSLTSADQPFDGPRKSRKAGVGLSLKF